MKIRARLTALIVVSFFAGAALASGERIGSEAVSALVAKGELMPLEEILRRNEALIDGRIVDIELERKANGYVYEIKVLRRDGRKIELKFDGRSGELRGRGK